eukprot:scaffold14712_cov124-Isochrysis_galbana.AAC.4
MHVYCQQNLAATMWCERSRCWRQLVDRNLGPRRQRACDAPIPKHGLLRWTLGSDPTPHYNPFRAQKVHIEPSLVLSLRRAPLSAWVPSTLSSLWCCVATLYLFSVTRPGAAI